MTLTRRSFLKVAPAGLGGAWLLAQLPTRCLAGQGDALLVAYSLRAAQERLHKRLQRGGHRRSMPQDMWRLAGITRPRIAVVDVAHRDVILVGQHEAGGPALTLDDVAVALRARFLHPTEEPGVTINGRTCRRCKAAGRPTACPHEDRQDVEFFAGIGGSGFGETCYVNDWYLKELGLGLRKPPVPGLEIYYDLAVAEARRNPDSLRRLVYSRFWFYPLVSQVHVFGEAGVTLLERFQIAVFTQLLHAEMDGRPIQDLSSVPDPPSERFSRSFSRQFRRMAEHVEHLRRLEGLTQLAGLCKGLTRIDGARGAVDYLLSQHRVEPVSIPPDVPVLKREDREVGLLISGGVVLSSLATKARGGDPEALKELVVRTRPTPGALAWEVALDPEAYTRGVASSRDQEDLGPLFAEGHYMFLQKEYDRAVAVWRQIAKPLAEAADAGVADVYWWIGRAFERKGMPACAADYYTKALRLDPFLENLNRRNVSTSAGAQGNKTP